MRSALRQLTRWRTIVTRYDEVESRLYETLAIWIAYFRAGQPDGLRRGEEIPELAGRLLHQVARQEKREYSRQKKLKANLAVAEMGEEDHGANPEAQLGGEEVKEQVGRLMSLMKPRHQDSLEAQKAHTEGAGPPPAEALGLTPASFRKLLSLARTEFLELLVKHELELPLEWRQALGAEVKDG